MYKILIAHSDPKLVNLYHRHLSDHFSVDSAHDGLVALRKIRLIKPALVVSDLSLPVLSGLALLRFVRSHPDLNMIPFIFLSDSVESTEALNLGASEWILRTQTSPEKLLERAYHHLRINKSVLTQLL